MADSVAGSLSYTYDDRFDAVLTETGPTGTMTYAYYANGLRKSATPSGGTAINYGYDVANRLKTINQTAGSTSALPASALNVGMTYVDADRRQTLTLAVRFSPSDSFEIHALEQRVSNVTRTMRPIVIELQCRKNTMRLSHPFVGSSWWFMKIHKKI